MNPFEEENRRLLSLYEPKIGRIESEVRTAVAELREIWAIRKLGKLRLELSFDLERLGEALAALGAHAAPELIAVEEFFRAMLASCEEALRPEITAAELEELSGLRANTNAELLAYYTLDKMRRVSAEFKLARAQGDRPGLERLAKVLRLHHTKLSQWNIAAAEHSHANLVAAEEYMEAVARDIETLLRKGEAENEGEEWKG